MKYQKNKFQKVISIILLFVMIITVMAGCGNAADEESSTNNVTESGSQEGDKSSKEQDENVAMGRYVEDVIDLSEEISGWYNQLTKLSDGRLIITDKFANPIISNDNGATWEVYQQDWMEKLLEDQTYIFDLKVGSDGTFYVVYDSDDEEQQKGEETESEEIAVEETESEEDAEADEGYTLEINTRLMIVRPDGTQQFVDSPVEGESKFIRGVWVSEEGRVFITLYGEPIYEVMEDGSCEKFLSIEGSSPELIQFQDNLMIIDGYGYDGFLFYDMEKKTYLEDQVLADFLNANYKERDTNGGNYFQLYFFPTEEGVLYLAGEKGMYRHVIGGGAIEQVIDGKLSTFNNPAYSLEGAVPLENNEFLVLFTQGKLIRYTYDPNIPTVPNETLKVYSLKENDLIRQAVSLYQTSNPEVFVEYEIGMDENNSVTREDALKSLNTKIMAGDGPDVLILDNMPMDSYIDKGLLLDLSSVLNGLEGEDALFTNIVNAFSQDGKIYMIPSQVQLPTIYGREKYISQMKDLESMADMIEKMREDIPQKDLLSICSARGIMRMYAMTSAPAWKTESGEIDKQNISDFLAQTKRIYDAQMDGLADEVIEHWDMINENYIAGYGITREDYKSFRMLLDELGYLADESQMQSGTLYYAYGYASAASVSKVKNFEDCEIIPMPGQSENVFIAETIAGISAASESVSYAEDFLRTLLGKENQSSTFGGFPVNKAAFEESMIRDESDINEDGTCGSVASADAEGHYVEMNIYWPDENQIDALRKRMEGANTPYIEDTRLEDAVYEEGAKYIQGMESLDEAVAAIEEKVALYMAE